MMLKSLKRFFVQFLINLLKLMFISGAFVGTMYGFVVLVTSIKDKYGDTAWLFSIIFLVAVLAAGLWTWMDGAFNPRHTDDNQF